jgi:hypothetical protein
MTSGHKKSEQNRPEAKEAKKQKKRDQFFDEEKCKRQILSVVG